MGQRVAALLMTGGYSQFTIVPEADLVPVPEGLGPAEAVSLVLNYVTAYHMLHRVAQVRSGQDALFTVRRVEVGTAALAVGKNYRCLLAMFGTASKPKHELVFSLGAEPIYYRTEIFST